MFTAKKSSLKTSSAARSVSVETLEGRQMLSASPVLWADDTQGRLFTVNTGTGQVHVVGKMPAVMFDIAFDSHGNLYGVDGASGTSSLWKINPSNASATRIGSVGAEVNSLVFSGGGTLYAAGTSLYKLSTANGHGTRIGSTLSGYSSAGDLAFDSSGNLFLTTTSNYLVKVNASTGTASKVGSLGFSLVYGMAYGPNGVLYGMSDATDQIFAINKSTGHGTLLSSFANQGVAGVNGSAFAPSTVKTPTGPVGLTIYAADSSGNLFTLNSATGATHIIGHMSTVMFDIAGNSSGALYGVDGNDGIWKINPANASISPVGKLNVNDSINSLTFGPDGDLYAAGSYLYKIDLVHDVFYTQGYLGGYQSAGDLAFDKYGRLDMTTTSNQLVTVNPSNGATTFDGNIGFSQVLGLAEGSDGVLYGMSDTTDQIFSVNPITGQGTDPVRFSGVNGVFGATLLG